MKLYEIIPQKDTKRLNLLTSALLIGAALMLAFTVIFKNVPYKWAFQLIGVGMLAIGIFYLSRYVMRSFIYRVERTDDGTDLTVTEVQGRKAITVCRISVEGIEEVYTACPADRNEMTEALNKAKKNKRKHYNYCVDMFGDKCLFVLATECGEDISLRLSYDETLEQWLSKTYATED
jgi:hypothetical protein